MLTLTYRSKGRSILVDLLQDVGVHDCEAGLTNMKPVTQLSKKAGENLHMPTAAVHRREFFRKTSIMLLIPFK